MYELQAQVIVENAPECYWYSICIDSQVHKIVGEIVFHMNTAFQASFFIKSAAVEKILAEQFKYRFWHEQLHRSLPILISNRNFTWGLWKSNEAWTWASWKMVKTVVIATCRCYFFFVPYHFMLVQDIFYDTKFWKTYINFQYFQA